ncbi:hypothetical protein NEOLEDRAFT_1184810 [Neolentinus lepideus HHB14362 ss-1]|uniref:Uncharacterized protein n=1 Tax=Neolentinus lepideus HHB14362 ss-1 TaxID=1314782 RepID=A0A165M5B4_9AGAM|nr:hypothetical protein NEOLEDRAFT_1184810 [Neolentinus lepideus HHB14362 ss-1]
MARKSKRAAQLAKVCPLGDGTSQYQREAAAEVAADGTWTDDRTTVCDSEGSDIDNDTDFEDISEALGTFFAKHIPQRTWGRIDPPKKKQKVTGNRPPVYRGDSHTMKWRQRIKVQASMEAGKTSCKITSYFTKWPRTLSWSSLDLSDTEVPAEDVTLHGERDFLLAGPIINHFEADRLALYFEELDSMIGEMENQDVDGNNEAEYFEVSDFDNIEETAGSENELADVSKEDEPVELDTINEDAEVTAARELLREDDVDEGQDILAIIRKCLVELRKLQSPRTIKGIMKLTAVLEYVKLFARRMGKGHYFARQIHESTHYLRVHGHLPLPKVVAKMGRLTLFDNESTVHGVQKYLAGQKLGTITPRLLCQHVNNIICPTLGLSGKDGSISERTAINWLHKLGYACRLAKKGLYHDGHERPDMVEAHKKFLEEMVHYEKFMATYDDKTLERIPPALGPGQKEHVAIDQDESIFHVGSFQHSALIGPVGF